MLLLIMATWQFWRYQKLSHSAQTS